MPVLKSERHHWWPECVSRYWKNADGGTHWLLPDGEVRCINPKQLGVIGNGHHIKLGKTPGEDTAWDQSYEKEFQFADSSFPAVIDWLETLSRVDRVGAPLAERFLTQDATDEELRPLVACLVSLAARSPRNREVAVSVAEHYRGSLPERERNALIGLNMRNYQSSVVNSLGTRGKFVVIYSPHREFIFGDGFFHNITSIATPPYNPKLLAPLTPGISVLHTIPTRYMTLPRLMTLVVSADEANELNNAVQIYAKEALYYRSEKPTILDDYRVCQHLRYATHENPIDRLIHTIPGIPPRDTSLDHLFSEIRRKRS